MDWKYRQVVGGLYEKRSSNDGMNGMEWVAILQSDQAALSMSLMIFVVLYCR